MILECLGIMPEVFLMFVFAVALAAVLDRYL